jgi:predicted unusual protein kinase regulating ubiquinone biosynthesis (AarF/ABC1/UbiB family)
LAHDHDPRDGAAAPSGRLARLAVFGAMAGGVAGGMMASGARHLASGRRPSMGDMLLTPANALRVTRQLSHLRGAAMKLGQLMSLDGGGILPPELTKILGALREGARPMPPAQLDATLIAAWGKDWRRRFERFAVTPIAAASIGQVHRARTRDGRDLAIKVQYPGVRRSIDSDVSNVAALVRMSGLAPAGLDLGPLLDEAKRQLHEEADYLREGRCLRRFADLLADDPDIVTPILQEDLTTPDVLAMTYVEGGPVEMLADAPQAERDRIAALLIDLALRETFEFGLMQTDPNFANYRYDRARGTLALLDFGATREISPELARAGAGLLRAGFAKDEAASRAAAIEIGLFEPQSAPHHQDLVMAMFEVAMGPLSQDTPFDFADPAFVARMRDGGIEIAAAREFTHVPPIDMLFLQRKVGGMFLLASRLGARVAIRPLIERRLPPAG